MIRHALLAMLALVAVVGPAVTAQTNSVQVMNARLPDGTEGPAAAVVGGKIYVFGGYHGSHTEIVDGAEVQMHERSNKIWSYDPATDKLTEMGAKMPKPRHWALASAVGDMIYVFGGFGCGEGDGNRCESILRYDPSADRVTQLEGNLSRFPIGYFLMAGATVGDSVYIAGGETVLGRFDEMWQFNSTTETLRLFEKKFPVNISAMGAAAVGTDIYFFGGQDSKSKVYNSIWRFDTKTEVVETLRAKLPREALSVSVATDGSFVYVFGGQDYPDELDSIVRFAPQTNGISLLQAKLPGPRFRAGAAWVGDAAYIIGGAVQDHTDEANTVRLDEIVRFGPSSAATDPTQEIPESGGRGIPGTGFVAAALVLSGLVALRRRR